MIFRFAAVAATLVLSRSVESFAPHKSFTRPIVSVGASTTSLSAASTLYDKIWSDHVVNDDGLSSLLYIDRHLVHEVTSPQAFEGLRLANRSVRRPDCTLATVDHGDESDRLFGTDRTAQRVVDHHESSSMKSLIVPPQVSPTANASSSL